VPTRALVRTAALPLPVLVGYIEHTGSALFACPPGLSAEADWGTQLYA
jgi:hypothetical protein